MKTRQRNRSTEFNGLWPILRDSDYSPLHPCNYQTDINPYVERLDLEPLAKLCCQGMKGRLYFVSGKRDTPQLSPMLAGSVSGLYPYLPASFLADGEIELARFLDNIWFLYQLEQKNLIEPSDKSGYCWRWSNKALLLSQEHGHIPTLNKLTKEQRTYFAALSLIEGGDLQGELPHIQYKIIETSECVSEHVDELRGGEGYPSGIGLFSVYDDSSGLIAENPSQNEEWREYISLSNQAALMIRKEHGRKLIILPDDKKHGEFYQSQLSTSTMAPYQFDFFVCTDSPLAYYKARDKSRRAQLIYEKE